MRKLFLIFLFLHFINLANSSLDDNPFIWRYWDVSDGMAEEYYASMTLGNDGKVYVNHGYSYMISILDGYTVDTIPLPGPSSVNIYQKNHVLWSFSGDKFTSDFGKLRYGLQRYVGGNWERYSIPQISAVSNDIQQHIDNDNIHQQNENMKYKNVWRLLPIDESHIIVVLPKKILLFRAKDQQIFNLLEKDTVNLGEFTEIAFADETSAYVAAENGLIQFDWQANVLPQKFNHMSYPVNENLNIHWFRHIYVANDGLVYVTALDKTQSKSKAIEFNQGKYTFITTPETQDHVVDIWKTNNDEIFMLTEINIRTRLSQLMILYNNFSNIYELPTEIKSAINFRPQFEENGNMWLNLYLDGVARGAKNLWRKFYQHNESSKLITNIHSNDSNQIVIGYHDAFSIQTNDSWKFVKNAFLQEWNLVSFAPIFDDSCILISRSHQLGIYNYKTDDFNEIQLPEGYEADRIFKLINNTVHIIFQSTENNHEKSLWTYKDSGLKNVIDFGSIQDIGSISDLLISQRGDIWIGGLSGIRVHSGTSHDSVSEYSSQFPFSHATEIMQCEDESIWVGSRDGIAKFKNNNWEIISKTIPAIDMLQAKDQSIWAISKKIVYRFHKNSWVSYGPDEGIKSELRLEHIYEDHAGNIYIGTNQDCYRYDSNADADPPKTIVNAEDNNTIVAPDGNVRFVFSGVDKWKYTPVNRLLYSYSIDGKNWSPYQEYSSVFLRNIPYGSHTFSVRAMDRNWNIDPNPKSFEFTVLYPWYYQTYFVLGLSILLLIMLYRFINLEYLVRLRTASMKKEIEKRVQLEGMVREVSEREQRRIGQDLHDGLSQLLAGTLLMVRQLQVEMEINNYKQITQANDIENFLQKSVSFTQNLIRGLTPISISNFGLEEALKEYVLNVNKLFKIKIHFECICEIDISNTSVKTNIYRIIQEAVNNAVKYSKSESIYISVESSREYYHFYIKDNGKGFDTTILRKKGMGLQIMQYRSSLFQGSVTIESREGSGTCVKCTVPRMTNETDAED